MARAGGAGVIRLRGVTIAYGGRPAVRGVDLHAPRGRITALVGPSGCGKSSVLAAVNRLLELVPGASVEGAVEVDGRDVRGEDPVALRRRVGLVLQRPEPFPLSIRRNVELGLREHVTRDRAELRRRAERALREVGLLDELAGRLDESALKLSGGQRQRLCLARALALEPEAVLLDEPCSALDVAAAAVVERQIAALRGRVTVVLVTHDLASAARLADEVVVFALRDGAGAVVAQGPAERVLGGRGDHGALRP